MNVPPTSTTTPAIHESRKRYALFYPPRTSVPIPGAGSPFGRGFWQRLQAADGGCFLLFFISLGLLLLLVGLAGTVGPFRDGLRESADPRFFMALMALGTIFVLLPLRMLQIVLRQAQSLERGKLPADPRTPWTSDYPWRPEGMLPDYAGDVGGSVLGVVGFCCFVGVLNVALLDLPLLFKLFILALDLLCLFLLFNLILKSFQALRNPRTRLRWATFPAFLGGQLEGTLSVRPGQHVFSALTIKLRCVQDERNESYQGNVGLEPHVIYEQSFEILPPGDTLKELPLAFDLPDDLPGNHLDRAEAVYWQLAIRIPVTGPDIEAVFLAPVYERAQE